MKFPFHDTKTGAVIQLRSQLAIPFAWNFGAIAALLCVIAVKVVKCHSGAVIAAKRR